MNTEPFNAFPTLSTRRLRLDKLTENSLNELIPIASFRVQHATRKDAEDLLKKTHEQYGAKQAITWGLYLKNELIGTIGFYRGFANNIGEVGYVMREDFKRRGYMREALHCIIRFGFETMELDGISAFTRDDNTASVALLGQFGFQRTPDLHEEYRKHILRQNSSAKKDEK